MNSEEYQRQLYLLQVELVKLQKHFIARDDKILLLLEGRDGAGKDSTIKRIIQHLSPRETRVVALGKPSDRDCGSWYFQRYVSHLPTRGEFVLFNRSWYNRAGVERVMGFCSKDEWLEFEQSVIDFESMLVRSGIKLFKYYLDIDRKTQKKRLQERLDDPLKQWKRSPVDDQAMKLWKQYSAARNEMFARTHHPLAPWVVVRANYKKVARLQLIRHLLGKIDYHGKDEQLLLTDPDLIFEYDPIYLEQGLIAP